MKLTKWEVERVIESLESRLEEVRDQGRGTKSYERLLAKVCAHAELTGKRRVVKD